MRTSVPRLFSLSAVYLVALTACQGSDTVIFKDEHVGSATREETQPHRFVDRTVPKGDGEQDDISAPDADFVEVQGSVAGISFQPTHAIVLRGKIQFGDRPDATVFVASNVPNMCEHLQRGTLPANGTMFAMALVKDGGAPIADGDRFFPGGEQGEVARPMLHGFFRRLDDQCHIDERLLPVGGTAQKGAAQYSLASGGRTSLSFDLGMGFDDEDELAGHLSGTLVAPACDAPKLFENAGAFFNGDIPEGGCIGAP